MGNENLLPKNIRQIGEIQGRQKICLEDYVVTYIRKIENRGDENFLGIFLGERKNTENADYVFVRGLMEVPDAKEQKGGKAAADGKNAEAEKTAAKGGQNEASDKDITKEKISLWEAFQRRYGTQEDAEEADPAEWRQITDKTDSSEKYTKEISREAAAEAKNAKRSGRMTETKNPKQSVEGDKGRNAQKEACMEPQDIWEQLKKECKERFSGCEILGCCVIGAYPAGRAEELSSHIPEAGQMLYHLQDQEERLYWRDGDRFEGVKGYFVFYEQNRQMQAYLAETFGGDSAEKEKVPDDAIRSFREKVKSKADERSRSFLKLASSFFVVGILIIGVVMVNRVADLRQVQSVVETVGGTSATEEAAAGQMEEGVTSQMEESVTDPSGSGSGDSGGSDLDRTDADDAVTVGSNAADYDSDLTDADDASQAGTDVSSAGSDSSDASSDNGSEASDSILTGSDAFWADDESSDEDASGASESASVSESAAADSGSASSDVALNSGSVSASDAAASDVETSSDLGTAAGTSSEAVSGSSSADATVTSDSAEGAAASAASDAATVTAVGTAAEAASETTAAETAAETTADADPGSASGSEDGDDAAEASARQVQAAYVIREGDTLAEICAKYYGSLDYLEALCEANEIEDANLILPGQKIVLP